MFQVSRPYLGFCPDPKHFIVNFEQNVVKFAGKWGKMYWKMQFLCKIFWQNKMLCRPTIPRFFQSWNLKHTYIYIYIFFFFFFFFFFGLRDTDLNKSPDFLLNPLRIYVCITRIIYMVCCNYTCTLYEQNMLYFNICRCISAWLIWACAVGLVFGVWNSTQHNHSATMSIMAMHFIGRSVCRCRIIKQIYIYPSISFSKKLAVV